MIETQPTMTPGHEDAWEHASRITDALAELFQRVHAQQGRRLDLTRRPFEEPVPDERTFDQLLADIAMLSHTYKLALNAAIEPTVTTREDVGPVNWIAAAADTFRALSALSLGTEPHWVNHDLNARLLQMAPQDQTALTALAPTDITAPEGRRTIKQTTLAPGEYWTGDPCHMANTLDLKRFLESADEHTGLCPAGTAFAAVYTHPKIANHSIDLNDNRYHTPSATLAAVPLSAARAHRNDAVLESCGHTLHSPEPLLCSLREDGVVTFGPLQIRPAPPEATQKGE